jgi:hypothetical protein
VRLKENFFLNGRARGSGRENTKNKGNGRGRGSEKESKKIMGEGEGE